MKNNNGMRKIITLLLILMAVPLYSQWIEQNSGVDKALNDVYCVTQDLVFVVGNNGIILKTTDGGTNWIQKNSGTIQDLMKVQFVNSNVGFALGAGTLLKTIDGGENWNPIDIGGTSNFYFPCGLSCISENVFYISSALWFKKTINGGITFETLEVPVGQNIENIQFLTEQIGYKKGLDKLYKTNDGGTTWTVILNNYDNGPFFFLNQNIGFVNSSGAFYKTTDGGLNFSLMEYQDESMLQGIDIFSLNENVIWQVDGLFLLCGCPPEYCVTKKNQLESPENQVIHNCDLVAGWNSMLSAIHFANDTNGYVVGYFSYTGDMGPPLSKGTIFKNSTGSMLGTNKADKKNEITIYPNPASDTIMVSFSENSKKTFSVEITNCLGEMIFSKFYQTENTAMINVESLPKGIYFLTITSQEKRNTQKVVIK